MSPLSLISIKLICALLPCFLLFWFFRSRSRSPQHLASWTTFFLGCLSVIPAVIIELLIQLATRHFTGTLTLTLDKSFLQAAITEETLKFLVVLLYCSRSGKIRTPLDGLIYGALAALGFATVENILYVMHFGLWIALVRALLAVPGHALWGATMGYCFGQSRAEPANRGRLMVKGLTLAILLHGLFDFSLMYFGSAAPLVRDPAVRLVLCLLLLVPLVSVAAAAIRTLLLIRRLRTDAVELPILDVLPAEPELLDVLPAEPRFLDVLPAKPKFAKSGSVILVPSA